MDTQDPIDSLGLPVLVKKANSELYLREPNDWVEDRHAAKVFSDTASALTYCHVFGIVDFELALQIPS